MAERKAKKTSSPPSRLLFVAAASLGAFLIFQIQPIVSKRILPWYGGTPAVWTTCLLFFQVGLFLGYSYAHASVRFLGARQQAIVHALLLGAALAFPVLPGKSAAPSDPFADPIVGILAMLLATIGLPYVVLSATSPLIQAWVARLDGRAPWSLFAASNAGSLLALVTYPFLVEPRLDVVRQTNVWRIAFVAFAVLLGGILWTMRKGARAPTRRSAAPGTEGTARHPALWVGWSACAVILFMAVTNQLTLNVAAIPFLWILPLTIYLASFIVTFAGAKYYPRRLAGILLIPALSAFYLVLPGDVQNDSAILALGLVAKIVISSLALAVCCLVCHGELYRARPGVEGVTRFYLAISSGGVIGGVVVGVVAPRFFFLQQELQLGLLLLGTLYFVTARRDLGDLVPATAARRLSVTIAATIFASVLASVAIYRLQTTETVQIQRNFFGLLRVTETPASERNANEHVSLYHGSTLHGLQLVAPDLRRLPTLYYGPISGVGLVLRIVRPPEGRKIGVVGLGVGTVAAYGEPDDHFRFYEIDPEVVEIAQSRFTYLGDSAASWEAIVGDARLSLEREPAQQFDVLVLDAFSSDAIPVHLLTAEAMAAYVRHLRDDGILAIHVSNRYLDLSPVVDRVAEHAGLHALHVINEHETGGSTRTSHWALLARHRELLNEIGSQAQLVDNAERIHFFTGDRARYGRLPLWTDDSTNLFRILR